MKAKGQLATVMKTPNHRLFEKSKEYALDDMCCTNSVLQLSPKPEDNTGKHSGARRMLVWWGVTAERARDENQRLFLGDQPPAAQVD